MTGRVTSNRPQRTPEQELLYRWARAACSVGICGSEYHNDPERVFARVAEVMGKYRTAKIENVRLKREVARRSGCA